MILGLVYGYIPFMILPLYAFLDRIQEQPPRGGARPRSAAAGTTFWRVTLPLSRPAILAGIVIVTLPMFGDYYTNDLLGTTKTAMFGNLIAQQKEATGRRDARGVAGPDAVRDRVHPDALLPPRDEETGGAGMSAVADAPAATQRRTGYFSNPWRKPRFLQATTILYLLWSLLPVLIAVDRSRSTTAARGSSWQGFSLRWWTQDPTDSILHDPAIRTAMVQTYRLAIITVLITVPLGTLFAIGIDRWHGRPARIANFTMLLSFVVPEIILGRLAVHPVHDAVQGLHPARDRTRSSSGSPRSSSPIPTIIVRARLLSIGPAYEEAAMDLGASPGQAIRRVLLPLLAPAIMASVALVFADCVDDFVTVAALSGPASSETLAQKIYSAARSSPTPEVNAAATVMLVSTLLVITIGLRHLQALQPRPGAGRSEGLHPALTAASGLPSCGRRAVRSST